MPAGYLNAMSFLIHIDEQHAWTREGQKGIMQNRRKEENEWTQCHQQPRPHLTDEATSQQ